jgi:hypothetical protein
MATAPIEAVNSFSKIGSHLTPPEVDFQIPPEAVPTYIILGSAVTTSIAVTRPDIPPGPIFLGFMFFTKSIENSCEKSREVVHKKSSVNSFFIRIVLFDFNNDEQDTK